VFSRTNRNMIKQLISSSDGWLKVGFIPICMLHHHKQLPVMTKWINNG
jgi:hypothetical protein